jgi:TrmH family RNA methyltransferase
VITRRIEPLNALANGRFNRFGAAMSLKNVRIVLVRPLYGGNVGSVCRAMMNMGLSDLAIVNPREEFDEDEMRMMALTAVELYEQRREFATLAEAVGDCTAVGATSARVGFYRDQSYTIKDAAPQLLEQAAVGPVALVFGPEDAGLNNDDLKIATHIVRIPSTDEYMSLNLSQAVMVCAYELFCAAGVFEPSEEISPDAPIELREIMFKSWRETLLDIGFFKEDKSEHMMMGLRRILSRGKFTVNDAKIMIGISRQSQWAAKHGPKDEAE